MRDNITILKQLGHLELRVIKRHFIETQQCVRAIQRYMIMPDKPVDILLKHLELDLSTNYFLKDVNAAIAALDKDTEAEELAIKLKAGGTP